MPTRTCLQLVSVVPPLLRPLIRVASASLPRLAPYRSQPPSPFKSSRIQPIKKRTLWVRFFMGPLGLEPRTVRL